MDYRSQVRRYVTEVWNYSDGMVDGFDDYDYEIVKNTVGFNTWNFKQSCINLGTSLYNPFSKITEKIKGCFK